MSTLLLTEPQSPARVVNVPTTPRLRIAWICPFLPKPEFGGAVRCYYLVREASTLHDVDLLCIQDEEPIPQGFLPAVRQIHFFKPDVSWSASKLRSLLSTQSQQRIATRSAALNTWLARHAAEYDVVVCEFTRGAWAKIPPGPARILDMHNIEHELLLRTAASDPKPIRRAYRWLDGKKLQREEKDICGQFDLVATCSDREREVVATWMNPHAVVSAPNGVDCPRFRRPENYPHTADLLFLGSMNYFPNEQAVRWFHADILPVIRRMRPHTTIRIVGVNPTPALLALNTPGFAVVGGVPDVRPEYWGARLMIVPILSGSGTRLKILEAAGAALPIVSTTIGCEGIDFKSGQHGRIADSPEGFAAACVDLLNWDSERARLGANARQLAVDRYDWAAIARGLFSRIQVAASREELPL